MQREIMGNHFWELQSKPKGIWRLLNQRWIVADDGRIKVLFLHG